MGRHSTGNQWVYYRSVAAWLLRWTLLAVMIGAAVWFALDAGEGAPQVGVASERDQSHTTGDGRRSEASGGRGTEVEASRSGSPSRTRRASPGDASSREPLITEGITVQVLNSTESSAALDRVVERLQRLGFAVTSIESAAGSYEVTTVFWSYPEARAAASRLADRLQWEARPKPGNLSASVSMHVVVGSDES